MKLFTRIAATINASADSAVTRFENHEAIAESALKGIRQNVAQARVRHQRVIRDGEALRGSMQSLQHQITLWSKRARDCADSDESRALACLERRAACREQLKQAEDALREHMALEAQASSRLEQMQRRLEQATLQRNQLRSRESVAKANQAIGTIDGQGSASIDEVFERWESSIGESEVFNDMHISSADPLDHEFHLAETRERLKNELNELMQEEGKDA